MVSINQSQSKQELWRHLKICKLNLLRLEKSYQVFESESSLIWDLNCEQRF